MADLLRVENLSKAYARGKEQLEAVDSVSLSLAKGETLGLVGESGCGKTTLGRSILRLYTPDAGRIVFDGQVFYDSAQKKQPDAAPFRRRMQMIFQDPGASLDPRKTVRQAISQAMKIHGLFPEREARWERIAELLALVGLGAGQMGAYPHELSGGQQQRVAIARALATEPDFLVCDEPVSALDLSIQAQIIQVLQDLQAQMGLSYLFIGHDLSVVRQISQRIAVMYLGRIVEEAPSDALVNSAKHPYTQALLAAVPVPDPASAAHWETPTETPIPIEPDGGCPYYPRCPKRQARCRSEAPELHESTAAHFVACHVI